MELILIDNITIGRLEILLILLIEIISFSKLNL